MFILRKKPDRQFAKHCILVAGVRYLDIRLVSKSESKTP